MGGGASKSATSPVAASPAPLTLTGGEGTESKTVSPESDTYGQYSVTFRHPGSLGIRLMSRGEADQHVYVKSLIADSQAAPHAQRLHPGHLLVGIDGKSCTDLTLRQAMARIGECGRPCTLEFRPASDDFSIILEPGRKFGAEIVTFSRMETATGKYYLRVMVAVVRPGSLAQEHGVIAGDYIIQIGQKLVTDGDTACRLLEERDSPIKIVLARGDTRSRTSSTAYASKGLRRTKTTTMSAAQYEIITIDDDDDNSDPEHDHEAQLRELHSQMIDDMHTEQEEAEARLKAKNERKKKAMKNRVQERLRIRKLLKSSPEILKKTKIFAELSSETLIKVVDVMKHRKVKPSQNIVAQGDSASELMVIIEGEAEVLVDDKKVRIFGAQDILGEAAILGDPEMSVRKATVRAICTTHVLVLSRGQFNQLLDAGTIDANVKQKAEAIAAEYAAEDALRQAQSEAEEREKGVRYHVDFQEGTLGMKLMSESETSTSGVHVSKVVDGGQAFLSNLIDVGHRICAINSDSVAGKTFSEVMTLIRAAGRPCNIEFRVEEIKDHTATLSDQERAKTAWHGNDKVSFGVEFMADDEDESELSFANMQEKHEAIAERIQEHQRLHEEILRKKHEAQAKAQSNRVQERLRARKALKHSKVLGNTKLFGELPKSGISKIIDCMDYRVFSHGQNLVTQGDDAAEMMVIMAGTAEVKVDDRVVRKFSKLDMLGEGALLSGDHIRGATVTATGKDEDTKTQVLVLSRSDYERLLSSGVINTDTHKKARAMSMAYSKADAVRVAALITGEGVDDEGGAEGQLEIGEI